MPIRLIAWSIFILLGSVPAIAAEPAPFFPIMAWDGVPNDPAVLKKMHECGLTVAGFVPPAALDNCQAAGLKAIVSDPRVGGYDWQHVDPKAARKAVEQLFNKKVAKVHTINRKGKRSRNRHTGGYNQRAHEKRAIVTLAPGEERIDIFGS